MWGQGLLHDAKYCVKAARALAAKAGPLAGSGDPEILARSGAVISTVDRIAEVEPDRETGDPRQGFEATYPELFRANPGSLEPFSKGSDESIALKLFQDLPASFPTVMGQLAMLGSTPREDIDLLLINGGANDIDFQRTFTPTKFGGLEMYQTFQILRTILYDEFLLALKTARQKCPNALIVVPAYFCPFTDGKTDAYDRQAYTGTDVEKLEDMAEYMAKVRETLVPGFVPPNLGTALLLGAVVPLGFLFTAAYFLAEDEIEDQLSDVAAEMISKSERAFRCATYWQSRAVADFDAQDTGPGAVLANPRFFPQSGLFTAHSAFHQGYREAHEKPESARVVDKVKDARLSNDPRWKRRTEFSRLAYWIDVIDRPTRYINKIKLPEEETAVGTMGPTSTLSYSDKLAELRKLGARNAQAIIASLQGKRSLLPEFLGGAQSEELQGPRAVVAEMDNPAVLSDKTARKRLQNAVGAELMRLQRVHLASFLHPNEQGAERYADKIVEAVERRFDSTRDQLNADLDWQRNEAGWTLTNDELLKALHIDKLDPGVARGIIRPDVVAWVVKGGVYPTDGNWHIPLVMNAERPQGSAFLRMIPDYANKTAAMIGVLNGEWTLAELYPFKLRMPWATPGQEMELYLNGYKVFSGFVELDSSEHVTLLQDAVFKAPQTVRAVMPPSRRPVTR